MKKTFTPLILCLIHTLLIVIVIILLNRELVPYLKTVENYDALKGIITWTNNLLGISLIISFGYFLLDFVKRYRLEKDNTEK